MEKIPIAVKFNEQAHTRAAFGAHLFHVQKPDVEHW
jgi:hypothetical protein